ncbi:MAG: Nicotinate-nucleotide pyrophosphorylase (Carboxylating) [Methanocalculus sp. 52_23]|jgi:nicotinate-nucleotide pyrophosphorylase (carboxylating)|uniref:carboxylating nicotinate-nucleotide diphosphorylase n=1 Tax=Methanocalculus sp. TaxID=2004547 RepID=UPI000746188B|nr:carboxylating nicotinate-nucleotide diphosphorylase [Methanocalculus sp.]KUK71015.1 MAG: Nicotinate-nucleotide pyrophosphorylase (Carboxylating) [Methanocalculus sp. 52_23]HIJ06173.1 carboxylating nicotinate-nucleotide diphosphorylase [Methanocalculus sp.]
MIEHESLRRFLAEDAPYGDITTGSIIPDSEGRAAIISRETGVVGGLEEAIFLFAECGVEARSLAHDGDWIDPDQQLLDISGPIHGILLAERTVLNIMGRMSGIATATRRFSALIDSVIPGARIAGTRKTAPGLRFFDKKAIILGGGDPHRNSLSDAFLIKDNHLALVGIEEAVTRARSVSQYRVIELEVETPEDACTAAAAGADIIMLDNMDPETVMITVQLLKDGGLRERVRLEISGGITPANAGSYAGCGIDLVSSGWLTHSVKNFDLSLDMRMALRTIKM